jgi:hypothetical protein
MAYWRKIVADSVHFVFPHEIRIKNRLVKFLLASLHLYGLLNPIFGTEYRSFDLPRLAHTLLGLSLTNEPADV